LTETHKVYTSYPTTPSHQQPYFPQQYDQPAGHWGLWFIIVIGGLIITLWAGYRVMEWWESLSMPYDNGKGKYQTYPRAQTTDNTNTTIIKPAVKKWTNNFYKPKPVVPPRVFVAGRMNGIDYQSEGTPETKHLDQYDRNRYYRQKGVSINNQDDIEAKWEKDGYNGL
jgi:hypothetical protein